MFTFFKIYSKKFSHALLQRDCHTRWIMFLRTCMSGLNRGHGQFLNFLGASMIYNAKSVFLAVNLSLRWLNNVSCLYLVQVSLLHIGRKGLIDFFRYRPLLPIGWRIVQLLRQRRRITTNTAPIALGAIQASSQSTFINAQLYLTCE
jgi:hypothetical protein